MGGSRRANDGCKPSVAQLSGVGIGGGLPIKVADESGPEAETITIDLVNVDSSVAGAVSRGTPVSVIGGSVFAVSRRLGDLSVGDAQRVSQAGFARGVVYNVSASDPWAVVQLSK